MGSQGDIYLIYGVRVEAKCEWEAGKGRNPVIYSINGHTLCDDEDFMGFLEDPRGEAHYLDCYGKKVTGYPEEPIEYLSYPNGWDLSDAELSMVVLGHSGEHDGDMGALHFAKGLGRKTGKKGEALVGFTVAHECYLNSATECPPMDKIKEVGPRLISEIKDKLGLTVSPEDLRLHLLFDSRN